MGTIVVSTVINKAATLLFDVNNLKWSRKELLQWLNDGQRSIIAMMPEAFSKTQAIKLVSGVRQTLPSDGFMLLDVVRNMGTTGTTSGRMVKRVDRAILDETNPTWASDSASATTTMAMYNARDRVNFYVYPPSDGTGYVELTYSAISTELVETDVVQVTDLYVPALVDYMLFRAYSKNVEFAGNTDKAQMYFTSFAMHVKGDAGVVSKLATELGQLKETPPQQQGSNGVS